MTDMSNRINMDLMMPKMDNGSPHSMNMMTTTTTNVTNGTSIVSAGDSNTSMSMENDLVLVNINDYESVRFFPVILRTNLVPNYVQDHLSTKQPILMNWKIVSKT